MHAGRHRRRKNSRAGVARQSKQAYIDWSDATPSKRHAAPDRNREGNAIMAFIILLLIVELILAIVLPSPNLGAPVRYLLGIRRGEPN